MVLGPVTHTSSLPSSGARNPIVPAVLACKASTPAAALQTAEEFEMKPPAPTLASIGKKEKLLFFDAMKKIVRKTKTIFRC